MINVNPKKPSKIYKKIITNIIIIENFSFINVNKLQMLMYDRFSASVHLYYKLNV